MDFRVAFFFQAEDGIRDHCVTGVQTCALPICYGISKCSEIIFKNGKMVRGEELQVLEERMKTMEIGRASCRERV